MNPTSSFARRELGRFPTPLHRLGRLEAALGGGHLFAKRDDLCGFGLAGNKTRALEFLIQDAVRLGCDVVVSGGAATSNFAGAIALAAAGAGLECELQLPGGDLELTPVPIQLAIRSGARLSFTGRPRHEIEAAIDERCRELTAEGRRPYAVPRGGATPVGALGFAQAAAELGAQLTAARIPFAGLTVVIPTGSGASLAGFLAGTAARLAPWDVVGVSVSRPADEITEKVLELAGGCAELMGTPSVLRTMFRMIDAGEAHDGILDDADRGCALLALTMEGLLFDPAYGIKTLRAACDIVRSDAAANVVLWHTGGLPAAIDFLTPPGGTT